MPDAVATEAPDAMETLNSLQLSEMGDFSSEGDEPDESGFAPVPEPEDDIPPAVTDEPEEDAGEPVAPSFTPEQEQYLNVGQQIMEALQGMTQEQRENALVALGMADPAPTVELGDYEPTGAIEEAIHPILSDIVSYPQFKTQIVERMDRTASVADTGLVQNAFLRELVGVLCENAGITVPELDVDGVLKNAYAGKDWRAEVRNLVNPAAEKVRATKKQAAKARPQTPGNGSGKPAQAYKTMREIFLYDSAD